MMAQDHPGSDNTITGGTFSGPVVQAGEIHIRQSSTAPIALAQLPPRAAVFTGRTDELALLTSLLEPDQSSRTVLVSAVAGMAGVGKTTLAVQAGHAALQAGWFPGGVLFIDLHGYADAPLEASQALDALLRALGVPNEHIPAAPEERAALYRSVLAQTTGPVLVIADNASSEAQVRPLLPGSGSHKILLTSRHTLAGVGARLVEITTLSTDASVQLLDDAVRAARPQDNRITVNPRPANHLAALCSGLPLALQITAAILVVDPTLGPLELAAQLADVNDRLPMLRYDDGSGESMPSVDAAFNLSYERLDETNRRVFRLLAICPGPDASTETVSALVGLPSVDTSATLRNLNRAHLVEPSLARTGRWRMHDLLRLYASQQSDRHADSDGRDEAFGRLLSHWLDMTRAATAHFRTRTEPNIPGRFTGQEQALEWLDAEIASLIRAVQLAARIGHNDVALRMPVHLIAYLAWRGSIAESFDIMVISINTARRLGGSTYEMAAVRDMGLALADVHQYEKAASSHRSANLPVQGSEHLNRQQQLQFDRITSHDEVLTPFDAESQIQCERLQDKDLKYHQETAASRSSGDWFGEASALINLGLRCGFAGRHHEAIPAFQNAVTIFRQRGDRDGEAAALNRLSFALRSDGRLEEAIAPLHEAIAIFRQNGDRDSEAFAFNDLGMTLHDCQRHKDAITAFRQAIAIFRSTGDKDQIKIVKENLGDVKSDLRGRRERRR